VAYGPEVIATGRFVLGLGARAGVPEGELAGAIDAALRQAGLDPAGIACLATLDRRAAEAGVRAMAQRHGWPVLAFDGTRLKAVDVPNPAETVAAAVGTASVAEAAALLGAGPGAELVLAKTVFPRATVAIARGPRAERF
jgi:cobalamin biosynthesis protein CbiG